MTFKKTLGPNGTVIKMVSGKAGRGKKMESFMQLLNNLAKMLDLGSHVGAHWILNGSQKRLFFKKIKKYEK